MTYTKLLLVLAVLIVVGLLFAVISWKLFKTSTLLSKPIDCMPRMVVGGEENVQPDYWERLLGTRCVTY